MSKGRILIIEEQPDVADVISAHLTAKGYEVSIARSHDEGLYLARKLMPYVILINTSASDAYRTIRQIRLTGRIVHITLIEISSQPLRERSLDMDTGVDDIIRPIDLEEVTLRIKITVDRLHREACLNDGYPNRKLANGCLRELIHISKRAEKDEVCTYLDIKIEALDRYEREYGEQKKTEFLRLLKSLLDDIIEEVGAVDEMFGTINDVLAYPADDNVLIFAYTPDVSTLQTELTQHFAELAGSSAPYLKLSIGTVSSTEQRFETVDEIVELAAKRRDEAK
jgi:DNA-binding response OmpR family regulator